MPQLCSQNNHCLSLNIADQSKIFISLSLFCLEKLLPLLVSMVHNLFKTLEKTSSSQALLCHNISFYRILQLLFIAFWIPLNPKTMGFIAFQLLNFSSSYILSWPWLPYFLLLYHSIAIKESFCHPLSHTLSLMLHPPFKCTCPVSCLTMFLKIFSTMAFTQNLLIVFPNSISLFFFLFNSWEFHPYKHRGWRR